MAILSRCAAFLDGPVHSVDQIIVHFAGQFAIGGVEECLAEAGRAAIVDGQHRVAAVGKPLVHAVVAVLVARPRAAVHVQHHRQRPLGLAIVVAVRARRQRQIGR